MDHLLKHNGIPIFTENNLLSSVVFEVNIYISGGLGGKN